ncbi:MAG: hypothetical protein AAGD96_17595 [Chloroflexota bacterium]
MRKLSPLPFALSLLLALLLLVACSPATTNTQDDSEAVVILGESEDSATGLSTVSELQILIPANDMEVGTPRIPFILMDGGRMEREAKQVFLSVFQIDSESSAPIWEGTATNYSDYEVPYWVFYPQIDEPGNYGVLARILQADDSSTEAQFAVAILESAIAPAVGDLGVGSQTPVSDDLETIQTFSSDFDPDVDLYQVSLDEALNNGRPTVISFSTPAYCQTAICAPVLNSVKSVKNENSSGIDFVHVEIFSDFETFEVAESISEWQLQSEPWTYVLDSNGVITSRFAGPLSPTELQASIADLN